MTSSRDSALWYIDMEAFTAGIITGILIGFIIIGYLLRNDL